MWADVEQRKIITRRVIICYKALLGLEIGWMYNIHIFTNLMSSLNKYTRRKKKSIFQFSVKFLISCLVCSSALDYISTRWIWWRILKEIIIDQCRSNDFIHFLFLEGFHQIQRHSITTDCIKWLWLTKAIALIMIKLKINDKSTFYETPKW